jgi:hypothetical protein
MPESAVTPEYIQTFLLVSAGLQVSLEEAARLMPLVRNQRRLLAGLEKFDIGTTGPSVSFDPRFGWLR